MMRYVVLVGDMKVGKADDVLVTHALGSCLGLVAYDPVAGIGGLLHAMLPLSKINPEKAEKNPYMFVDTGVPAMFRRLYQMGGEKSRLKVRAAGCGQPMGKEEMFKIGDRNFTVLKKLLWKNNVMLQSHDVGGSSSRTLYFEVSSGVTTISSKGEKWKL